MKHRATKPKPNRMIRPNRQGAAIKGHTRLFQGGHLDGKTEYVEKLGMRPFVDKCGWNRSASGKWTPEHHFYVLTEPMPRRAQNNATYLYEYRPHFQPMHQDEMGFAMP